MIGFYSNYRPDRELDLGSVINAEELELRDDSTFIYLAFRSFIQDDVNPSSRYVEWFTGRYVISKNKILFSLNSYKTAGKIKSLIPSKSKLLDPESYLKTFELVQGDNIYIRREFGVLILPAEMRIWKAFGKVKIEGLEEKLRKQ